jgi:V/A-type H+-transporting ATPase subunit D
MNLDVFPTKGNLIRAKNSLALADMGYDLMDRKRNILIREIMNLIDQAKDIQSEIDTTFREAYIALQKADIENGISYVQTLSNTIPIEDSIRIKTRSIMGVDIPLVESDPDRLKPTYAFYTTRQSLDEAREKFLKVKELTIRLSMIENSAYRLALNIRKTQKRANALKNITIPRYSQLVKDISESLEEKDREEFTRLKVLKKRR